MTAPVREETALYLAFMGYSEAVGDRLVALYEALRVGILTSEEFVERAAVLVGAAQARMWSLADASLATFLTAETGRAVPALGIVAPDEGPRLRDGLATLLAVVDPEDPAARVARYGRAEAAGAFQDGYSVAMAERPDDVVGWKRVLNVNACELCNWLYRGGKVYPTGRNFHRHPGCGCHPEPVLRGV